MYAYIISGRSRQFRIQDKQYCYKSLPFYKRVGDLKMVLTKSTEPPGMTPLEYINLLTPVDFLGTKIFCYYILLNGSTRSPGVTHKLVRHLCKSLQKFSQIVIYVKLNYCKKVFLSSSIYLPKTF